MNSRPLAPQLQLLCLSGPSSSVYPTFLFSPAHSSPCHQSTAHLDQDPGLVHPAPERWGPSVTPLQTTRREAQVAWPCAIIYIATSVTQSECLRFLLLKKWEQRGSVFEDIKQIKWGEKRKIKLVANRFRDILRPPLSTWEIVGFSWNN